MKLGAFIITFNRPQILKTTIDRILNQTRPPDLILVVDNGNNAETAQVVQSFEGEDVLYYASGDNLGPAGAAAYALGWLTKNGCEWIYWGDDDDPPLSLDVLERLITLIHSNEHQSDLGGVGGYGISFNWDTGQGKRFPPEAIKDILDVDSIGGGRQLILNSEVVRSVGVPNARLFFGYEEPEYCLRIRQAGYRLLVDSTLMREIRAADKRLQQTTQRSIIPSDPFETLWRRYYSTRNYIFTMHSTFDRPDLARREAFKAVGRACTSWLRGPRYGATFAPLQIRAVLDGYRGRLGRTVLPQSKHR